MTPGKSFLVSNSFSPAAVAPKRRSGFSTAVLMSLSSFSTSGPGAGEALCASMVAASSSGAETAHAIAVESEGFNELLEEPESAFGKNPAVSTAADEPAVFRGAKTAHVITVESKGIIELLEEPESAFCKNLAVSTAAVENAGAAHAPAGESTGILGSFQSAECSDGCVASACARLPDAALASLAPASRVSSPAVFAVGSHARFTPMHDARNSCSHTAINSLRDQRCRKVRWSSTVGNRSVVQTVDMSPAPAAGTYRRSADEVHDQRKVSRKRQTGCSGEIQVLVLVLVLVVGLVWLGESQVTLRPSWRFLAHW